MKIAIFSKTQKRAGYEFIYDLFYILKKAKIATYVYEPFYQFLKDEFDFLINTEALFSSYLDLPKDTDLFLSIGGDGTMLESVAFVRNSGIPLAGINCGRMGFLANISKDEIAVAIDGFLNKEYVIEERELIQLVTSNNMFSNFNYAMNELTVHKKDTSSMITIHAFLNDEFLNSYWADGLIIATPTGSTAYSLSAGGPIVVPTSQTFVITPIAPHNLTVRPIVIPNNIEITLKLEGRSPYYLAALDYQSETFDSSIELKVKSADFKIKMMKLKEHNFFGTLRNKLMWGIDKRN